MITKSPQQQIFDEIFTLSMSLGFDTYEYLPAEGISYPFVFVGEQFSNDKRTKRHLYGEVIQSVHIYAILKTSDQPQGINRVEITDMIERLKEAMRSIRRTDGFYVRPHLFEDQTLLDTTTNVTLLHGVVEAGFTFH